MRVGDSEGRDMMMQISDLQLMAKTDTALLKRLSHYARNHEISLFALFEFLSCVSRVFVENDSLEAATCESTVARFLPLIDSHIRSDTGNLPDPTRRIT